MCQSCGEYGETLWHFLWDYRSLIRTKLRTLGKQFFEDLYSVVHLQGGGATILRECNVLSLTIAAAQNLLTPIKLTNQTKEHRENLTFSENVLPHLSIHLQLRTKKEEEIWQQKFYTFFRNGCTFCHKIGQQGWNCNVNCCTWNLMWRGPRIPKTRANTFFSPTVARWDIKQSFSVSTFRSGSQF